MKTGTKPGIWLSANGRLTIKTDPNPVISFAADVEIAISLENISDLFILVQMLIEKHLDFFLIDITHLLWRDGNHISILVVALRCQIVNSLDLWEVKVEDAKFGQLIHRNIAA
jgi:hypothetical protein